MKRKWIDRQIRMVLAYCVIFIIPNWFAHSPTTFNPSNGGGWRRHHQKLHIKEAVWKIYCQKKCQDYVNCLNVSLPAYSCPPTYISPGLPRRLDETAKAGKEEMKKKKTMIMLMTID